MKIDSYINMILRTCSEPEEQGGMGGSCSIFTSEEKSTRHASDRKNVGDLFRWGKILIWDIYKVYDKVY
jgi:hypothetical protein